MRTIEDRRSDAIKILEDKIDKIHSEIAEFEKPYKRNYLEDSTETSRNKVMTIRKEDYGFDSPSYRRIQALQAYVPIRELLDRIKAGEDPCVTRLEME